MKSALNTLRALAVCGLVLSGPACQLAASPYPDYNPSPSEPDCRGMEWNAQEIAARIRIGWNLGNTLEATGGETGWGNPRVSRELIQLVRDSGFNAVRIPAAWNQYADAETAEIDPEWMDRVEEVVRYCLNLDLFVLLDIHWDQGWLENNVTPEKQEAVNFKQQAFWEQIATRFRDHDQRLLFASANEPHVEDATQMAVLMSYHQTFVDAVRATGGRNAYRVLVVQGPVTDIEKTYRLMPGLPQDTVPDRMMAEVHCYSPWNFGGLTQDESWGKMFYYWGQGNHSRTDTGRNPTWGEEEEIDRLFGLMKEKFVDHGIPVVLGEFGAIRRSELEGQDLKLHNASRIHYLDYLTERATALGLIPFYWDNGFLGNHGFGILDRSDNTVFDPAALKALTEIEAPDYWQGMVGGRSAGE